PCVGKKQENGARIDGYLPDMLRFKCTTAFSNEYQLVFIEDSSFFPVEEVVVWMIFIRIIFECRVYIMADIQDIDSPIRLHFDQLFQLLGAEIFAIGVHITYKVNKLSPFPCPVDGQVFRFWPLYDLPQRHSGGQVHACSSS